MNAFLQRPSELILKQEKYAFLLTALFVCIPFFMWVAVAIMCLVTLRKGYFNGSKILAVGILTSTLFFYNDVYTLVDAIIVLIIGYGSAALLRAKPSWDLVGISLLVSGLLGIYIIYLIYPAIIYEQLNMLIEVIKSIDDSNAVLETIVATPTAKKDILAFYIFGIKALSLIFSAVTSLILARYIQSALFYPEGFRVEMRMFRAYKVTLIIAGLTVLGLFNRYYLMIAFVPLIVSYFMMVGISLMFYFLDRKATKAGLFLLLPMVIIPYVMLPVYTFFGLLDCLFNFRLRLPYEQNIKS